MKNIPYAACTWAGRLKFSTKTTTTATFVKSKKVILIINHMSLYYYFVPLWLPSKSFKQYEKSCATLFFLFLSNIIISYFVNIKDTAKFSYSEVHKMRIGLVMFVSNFCFSQVSFCSSQFYYHLF